MPVNPAGAPAFQHGSSPPDPVFRRLDAGRASVVQRGPSRYSDQGTQPEVLRGGIPSLDAIVRPNRNPSREFARMECAFLVRYGQAAAVGRFVADTPHARGDWVVVRSHRGLELGEVLVEATGDFVDSNPGPDDDATRIVRHATQADHQRAARAERERGACFEACDRLLGELSASRELDLIDVELLLDDRRAVLHYLGPHHLPALTGWLTAFRERLALEVMFVVAGRDVEEADHDEAGGCGHCSNSGGGCGSGGCGTSHGGCSDCGVLRALTTQRSLP